MAPIERFANLISSSINHVAFNPLVTATLLWILTKAPLSLRHSIIARIGVLRDPKRLARIVRALKVCLALGVASVVNKRLSDVALNNGRWTSTSEKRRWKWDEEVAVVTGGCSGIGELIVEGLVGKGVRVAVLDINELPASLQGSKLAPASFSVSQSVSISS
jgi:all-trans-retinol dehydrogenase (NAD+)